MPCLPAASRPRTTPSVVMLTLLLGIQPAAGARTMSRAKRGALFNLACGVSIPLLSLAGVHSVWAIMLPQYLYAIGHGVHQPCGQAGAVGPFPEKAGTAASLSGFAMTLTALGVGVWLGLTLDATVYPLTLGIGAFSVAVAAVAWTLVQRHGEPVPATLVLAEIQTA